MTKNYTSVFRYFTCGVCLLFCQVVFGQDQIDFKWGEAYDDPNIASSIQAKIDHEGNTVSLIYISGNSNGDFDPTAGVDSALASPVDHGLAITKIDSSGNYLFTKLVLENGGTTGSGFDQKLHIDNDGNMYITLRYDENLQIYTSSSSIGVPAGNVERGLVVKLDPNGDFLWRATFKGTGSAWCRDITTDDFGNCYVTGAFTDDLDYDPGAPIANASSQGFQDIFLVKLNSSGVFQNHITFGGSAGDRPFDVEFNNDTLYLSGYFSATIPSSQLTLPTQPVSKGATDCFIASFTTNLTPIWFKDFGSTNNEQLQSIAISQSRIAAVLEYNADILIDNNIGDTLEVKEVTTQTSAKEYAILEFDHAGNARNVIHRVDHYNGATLGLKRGLIAYDHDQNLHIMHERYDIVLPADSTSIVLNNDSVFTTISTSSNVSSNFWHTVISKDMELIRDFSYGFDSGVYPAALASSEDRLTIVGLVRFALDTLDLDPTSGIKTEEFSVVNEYFFYTHQVFEKCGHGFNNQVSATGPISLEAEAAGFDYQWLNCDNNYAPITGETSQLFTATANGNYAVRVASDYCVDTSQCVGIIAVSIEDQQEYNLLIYPNPAKHTCIIQSDNSVISSVELLDASGKQIKNINDLNHEMVNLPLADLPVGLYILNVATSDGQYSRRLIIE